MRKQKNSSLFVKLLKIAQKIFFKNLFRFGLLNRLL